MITDFVCHSLSFFLAACINQAKVLWTLVSFHFIAFLFLQTFLFVVFLFSIDIKIIGLIWSIKNSQYWATFSFSFFGVYWHCCCHGCCSYFIYSLRSNFFFYWNWKKRSQKLPGTKMFPSQNVASNWVLLRSSWIFNYILKSFFCICTKSIKSHFGKSIQRKLPFSDPKIDAIHLLTSHRTSAAALNF